ncbi:MAG: murein L,D-transpeptidase catalytic domain family protein [Flavobacteriales bacterium]|jgi:hypothetical protein|nr:murein L,D-transpeptidase catalytic domain family protein [Flavobacteriales bacterium]
MCARKTGKNLLFLLILFCLSLSGFAANLVSEKPKIADLLKVDSIYQEARSSFDVYAKELYEEMNCEDMGYEPFVQALTGYHNLEKRGELKRKDIITVIDFSKPSNEPRFYILDLCKRKLIHTSLVAHGRNSGGLYARHFSNEVNSRKSSLGFYVTTSTYHGKFKLALRLKGMEYSNSRASSRGVVMHGADYASYDFMEKNDCTLGRSYGCPALPHEGFEQVVEWIKEGSCLYIYYPSKSYQRYSKYLNRSNYLEDFVAV